MERIFKTHLLVTNIEMLEIIIEIESDEWATNFIIKSILA